MPPRSGLTVVAMGGNSLLDPSLPPTVTSQFEITFRALRPMAELLVRGERLVLTHGNGPQIGFLQLRSDLARGQLHEVPLDSLVADTQGALGYMIQRALRQHLRTLGAHVAIASIVTEVVVDPGDRAFGEPTKPVGRFYSAEEAHARRAQGWQMVDDAGRGFRRVVASPAPVEIVQLDIIRLLVDSGVATIACGGGGIPVTRDEGGLLQGVEAVIDKDRTSALLAAGLAAERLMITTGVDAVYRGYRSGAPERLGDVTVGELERLHAAGEFPPGSMGPKIEAAIQFVRGGGRRATICRPEDLVAAFDGATGTHVHEEQA